MIRNLALASALATFVACTGPDPIQTTGQPLSEYWGFDGTCRSWELVSSDSASPYALVGVLQPSTEMAEDGVSPIHTIEYRKTCIGETTDCVDGDLVYSISISVDRYAGTLVHAFKDTTRDLTFSPPIAITDGEMSAGDTITTSYGSGSVTAEFIQLESCDITWADWDGCAHVRITDNGAETGLGGEYWLANGWGAVAWTADGATDRWALERGVFSVDPAVCESEGLPLLE